MTEMRPGTYVFNDNSAFRYGVLGVQDCAARFVATVVSRAGAGPGRARQRGPSRWRWTRAGRTRGMATSSAIRT